MLQINNQKSPFFEPENFFRAAHFSKIIKIHSKLYKLIWKGRSSVENNEFTPANEGLGVVLKLHKKKICKKSNEEVEKVYAFIKCGGAFCLEKGPALLEPFIWQVAVLFGLEDLFAETARFKIGNPENTTTYSFQRALKGKYFSEYKEEDTLSYTSLKKAVLASILLSFYDVHEKNVLITDKGDIKFFDNSRSLPHSNGFIRYPTGFAPSFASCLFDLDQIKKLFVKEDIQDLREIINSFKDNIPLLKHFLSTKPIKNLANQLPPYWLNLDLLYDSLKERVEGLDKGLNQSKNLEDLLGNAIPKYKFVYALGVCYQHLVYRTINSKLTHTLGRRLYSQEVFNFFKSKNLPLVELYDFCLKPGNSFQEIEKYAISQLKQPKLQQEPSEKLFFSYKKDYKDLRLNLCFLTILQVKLRIPMIEASKSEALFYVVKNNLKTLVFADPFLPQDYFIIFQTFGGYNIFKIKFGKTNHIFVGKQALSWDEFTKLVEEKSWPEANNLPFLEGSEIKELSNILSHGQHWFRVKATKKLIIFKKSKDHSEFFIFPQDKEGDFLLYEKKATLQEIWKETTSPSIESAFCLIHKCLYDTSPKFN